MSEEQIQQEAENFYSYTGGDPKVRAAKIKGYVVGALIRQEIIDQYENEIQQLRVKNHQLLKVIGSM
jgi:hypothetical protein